jgi:putative membrane protein
MLRFLVGTVVNAIALWVTTLVLPAVDLTPYGGDGLWETIGSFLLVGALFGLVHAIVGPVIKVLAFPLYILTFGLIAFVINGSLLLLVAWLSNLLGADVFTIEGFNSEGLTVGTLGWAILASIVMSIAAFFTRALFKVLRIR